MRLTEVERDLISSIQLNATMPLSRLSRHAKHPPHVLNYALQKLKDSRVLFYHAFIDMSALDVVQYTVFFSLSSSMKVSKEALISYLVSSEQVSWVGLLGGDFQCGVSICVRTVPDFSDFLTTLGNKFGGVFFEKSIAVLSHLYHFRMKYLSSRKGNIEFLEIGRKPTNFCGDELDHKILSALANSTSPSRRHIATQLGVAHSTVDYRIDRLEKNNIIVGHSYLADTSAFGVHMYLLVLYVKTVDEKFKRTLFDFCLKHQNVNFLIEYLGAWDYEVGVEVENAKDILTITEQFYSRFGEMLNTIKVLQVFDYPKVSKYPFKSTSPF